MAREFVARKGLIVSGSTLISGSINTSRLVISDDTGYALIYSTSGNTLRIASNGSTPDMMIDTSGNVTVGLGSTTSNYRLDVKGSGATSSTIGFHVQNANGSSSFAVRDDGAIGIGTTQPVGNLNIFGGTGNSPAILTLQSTAGGSGNTGIYFRPYQNEAFANSATAQATILAEDTSYSAHIKFSTKIPGASGNALVERLRITGAGSVGIGTTTPAASLHVSGSAIISSSLVVGSGSLGGGENTLTVGVPPNGGTGEGGQILLSAPGGTYTSASMLDNYQNKFRVLRGTNAGSDAYKFQVDLHSGQVQIPNYNSVSAFSGTAVSFLSVDANGYIVTSNPPISFNNQGASYTLVAADADKLVEMNSAGANNLTVPTNASVPFATGTQIMVVQQGTGQTTIVASGGVTLRSAGGALKLTSQYSAATLVKKGTDEWYVFGDITT